MDLLINKIDFSNYLIDFRYFLIDFNGFSGFGPLGPAAFQAEGLRAPTTKGHKKLTFKVQNHSQKSHRSNVA